MAKKPNGTYKIVEIEKSSHLPELDSASAGAVVTLREHPGFNYLLAKLRLQRSLLQASLGTKRHKDIRDVEFLQSGIVWCGWLQEQLEKAIEISTKPAPRPAKPYELDAFEQLHRLIDVVGTGGSQETTPEFTGTQSQ